MSLVIVIFPSAFSSWSSSAALLWSTEAMVVTKTSGLAEPWLERRDMSKGFSVGAGPVGESGPWSAMLVDRKLLRRLMSSMSPHARSLFIAVVGLSGISKFFESWSGYLLRWSSYFRLGWNKNCLFLNRDWKYFFLLPPPFAFDVFALLFDPPLFWFHHQSVEIIAWNKVSRKKSFLLWWVAHKAFHGDVVSLQIGPNSESCGSLQSSQPLKVAQLC